MAGLKLKPLPSTPLEGVLYAWIIVFSVIVFLVGLAVYEGLKWLPWAIENYPRLLDASCGTVP